MNIAELMKEAHQTAVEKGWWKDGDRNFGEQVALMHSELSEALEDYRQFGLKEANAWLGQVPGNAPGLLFFERDGSLFVEQAEEGEPQRKPCGIASEFADVLIRIFDTCERYQIPLAKALEAKMAYNKSRPYRHGNKLA